MSVQIPLRGRYATAPHVLVDDEDAHLAEQRWYCRRNGYAYTFDRRADTTRQVFMHRLVMGLEPGNPAHVDHINGDPLDNRRSNLRLVTREQNSQNRRAVQGSASSYRGVYLRRSGKWRAAVMLDGRTRVLGHFEEELEAARAAARFRAEHMPFSVEDAHLLEVMS